MSKRNGAAVILAVVCIIAYGFSKGWFGVTTRSPAVEGTKVGISQPLDQENGSLDLAQSAKATK